MTAYTFGHVRPGLPPVLVTTVGVCARCEGTGVVAVPVCRRGRDHAGHDCGGSVCGDVEAPCPECSNYDYDSEGV